MPASRKCASICPTMDLRLTSLAQGNLDLAEDFSKSKGVDLAIRWAVNPGQQFPELRHIIRSVAGESGSQFGADRAPSRTLTQPYSRVDQLSKC